MVDTVLILNVPLLVCRRVAMLLLAVLQSRTVFGQPQRVHRLTNILVVAPMDLVGLCNRTILILMEMDLVVHLLDGFALIIPQKIVMSPRRQI